MFQSPPESTNDDDSLAVEEFLRSAEGSHDLDLGRDQISIADTIAPTENIFATIGKGANGRGVLPASHKLAMEDIYPDADLKPQDGDEGAQLHSDENHVAPAVYLMDIFVSLPPSVWTGGTSNAYIPSKANLLSPSNGSKSSKKKNKKHLAVTKKTAYNAEAGNRVIKLPPTISNKDTFLIVRQTLSELQETSHITCFHLEITVGADILESEGDSKVEGNVVVICQDFMEIGSLIAPHSTSCTLTLVPELYDIKKIRHHIKKVRDTILFPPLSKVVSLTSNNSNEANNATKKTDSVVTDSKADPAAVDDSTDVVDKDKDSSSIKGKNKDVKKSKAASQIPSVESVYQQVDIADFFAEVLFRTGKPDVNSSSPLVSSPSLATPPSVSASASSMDLNSLLHAHAAPALFSCIKSITLSGWNPPPPYRKVQGDLLYLEVITGSEGVFHITAISSGFYVNRNNRHHFDPTPSTPLHFHHSLWDVLLEVSGSFRSAWVQLCRRVSTAGASSASNSAEGIETSNPMDTIATFYSQGRGDLLMLKPQWIAFTPVPTVPTLAAVNSNSQPYVSLQTYDIYRAQEDLCDMYGVDELGATRDWNDEIQAVRFMPTKDVHEKIISARYEFKVLAEFTDACKAAAIAISSGLINPISDLEPQPVAVSDASKSSLSFPSAATSNSNQAHIFSYNGIFYSKAMDNKDSFRLCVGDEAYRKLASRDLQNQNILRSLNIPGLCTVPFTLIDYKGERIIGQGMIPGILAPQGDNFASLLYGVLERGKNLTVKNSSLLLLQTALKQLYIPTRTILKNPFPEESTTLTSESEEGAPSTPSKALLSQEEMPTSIRIDTNDDVVMTTTDSGVDPATVVSHVGPIELKLLKGSDGRMYCLEVMRLTPRDANYVKGDKGSGRLTKEWLDKTDDNLGIACVLRRELVILYIEHLVHSKRQELIFEFNKLLVEKSVKAEGKGNESGAKEAATKESEGDEDTQMETEYLGRIKAVSADTLGIEINPNCFLQFDSDVDAAVVARDEETARKMAIFLWDIVLPHLVNQVREGGIAPKDSEEMVKLLHSMGVNLRYLGHLCKLAKQQEDSDDTILKQKNMMKVYSMPRFWLELLLVEVLARAVKHHLNALYRSNPTVATAPALTIVSVLNHLFSVIFNSQPSSGNVEANGGSAEPAVAADHEASIPADEFVAQLLYPNAALSQDSCLESIQDIIASRFCLQVSLNAATSNQEESTSETESVFNISFSAAFLGKRLSPTALLRRICQLNGIQIAMRHYDFNSPKAGPFHVKDIVSLVPVVKSCQPDELLPEIGNLISSSAAILQQPGGIQLAFELMQQASQIATQIAGPLHKQTADVSEQIANLLTAAGDIHAAVQVTVNNLATANQLYGLDSSQSCNHHIQLAVLYSQLKNIPTAVNHLLSARYIIASTAGSNHPTMPDIYIRFGKLFDDLGDYEKACKFYTMAKRMSTSMSTVAHIGEKIALVLSKLGRIDLAIDEQKRAYTILKELIPDPKDSRVVSARGLLEKHYRSFIEEKKRLTPQQPTEQAPAASTAPNATVAANTATANQPANPSALEEEAVADGENGEKKKPKKKSKAKK